MSVDIQVVSKHPITPHGTTQLRCNQPAEYLRALGYSVSVETIYRTWPKASKLIIAHRILHDAYTRDFLTLARARGCAVVYDTDDLLFDADGFAYLSAGQKAASYTQGFGPFADAMAACDAVAVSTGFLETRAKLLNERTHVLLNALSTPYLALAEQVFAGRSARKTETVTLAYLSGSKSHDADFKVMEPALLSVLDRYPQVQLLLMGALSISDDFHRFGDRILRRGFTPYDSYARVFEEIDINLIPLETDHAFCHAKSELKFLEAGACGVVSVASATEPHKAAIIDGQNGRLAEPDNWAELLGDLIESRDRREQMGQAARTTVLSGYTAQVRTRDYAKFVDNVLSMQPSPETEKTSVILANLRLHAARLKRAGRRKISGLRNR